MVSLTLCLLGDFQARLPSGDLLAINRPKVQALLAYLALSPGNSQTRYKLADILWSDCKNEHARKKLNQTLALLRRDLAMVEPAPLKAGRGSVALNASAFDIDVANFEILAASTRFDDLQRAAGLYRGGFLNGLHIADTVLVRWLAGERERLHRMAENVLERLMDCQSRADAVVTARRLLAIRCAKTALCSLFTIVTPSLAL
jgi:DNA-binding SARP family transcriptional activator